MSEFTVIMIRKKYRNSDFMYKYYNNPHGVFQENPHAVKIVKDGFSLSADLTTRHNGTIYIEENKNPEKKSLVMSFGWCYRIGNRENQLEEEDMAIFLQSHRSETMQNIEVFSGVFCILSYDHFSESLWICTDMWAQHGFYYGSNPYMIVISSKASIVANYLSTNIDGISYLSLLRATDVPPGRTLYCNVWRVTCGRGLYLNTKSGVARLVQIQPLYRPIKRISFKDTVDQFIDVVTRVCPFAASRPSTTVDLTGGNDSRITCAALASAQRGRIGKQVTFKVVGEENHPDVIIARRIANIFDWTLRRNDEKLNQNYTIEQLHEAALLSDGQYILPDVLGRLVQEFKYWKSTDGLVNSLGGELFRDFFWRHELQRMGCTNKINFCALLKHRLHVSNDVDIRRISDGLLTIDDHNLYLLKPYMVIDSKLPDIKNVYKLDVIYLHKLMSKSFCWILSDLRKLIFPFLSSEITSFSLRIPWKFRVFRRLVTTAIEQIEPSLSLIPTDQGAPMSSLRSSTLMSYVRYMVSDIQSAYNRHYRKKRLNENRVSLSVPTHWLDIIANGIASKKSYTTEPVLIKIKKNHSQNLSKTQYREIQLLLLIELITEHYKGISQSLSFKGRDANFTDTTMSL